MTQSQSEVVEERQLSELTLFASTRAIVNMDIFVFGSIVQFPAVTNRLLLTLFHFLSVVRSLSCIPFWQNFSFTRNEKEKVLVRIMFSLFPLSLFLYLFPCATQFVHYFGLS